MQDFLSCWEKVLLEMESLVTAVSFDLYIATLEPLKIKDNKLYLMASTTMNKTQLLKLHRDKLLNAVKNCFDDVNSIEVVEPNEKEVVLSNTDQNQTEEIIVPVQEKSVLKEKYTFDNFVVGKSNQFVYAAARSVAENPGVKFNPLFIYGGTGLGKTHLLHSIGNYIKQNSPELTVLYVTSEQFTNSYINSLRAEKKENAEMLFRAKYRNVDVLMIDDIQFIASRPSTQEEFFHTFNDLYQNNKQIIITSDKHPRNIELLEERLRSRFTGGLIQDIQQPDFETRLAILQKKVQIENYNVNNDVLIKIAETVDTNIRELEGMLIKVISLSALIGKKEAGMDEAEEALKDMVDTSKENITIDKIIDTVCNFYNIKRVDLIGKKKNKEIVDPRQICIYLATEMLTLPLSSIGDSLGGRDHTTIIHARDKISKNIKNNKFLKTTVDDLKNMIKNNRA